MIKIKIKKKKISLALFLFILLTSIFVINVFADLQKEDRSQTLLEQSEIIITSDEDFISLGFQGEGTQENPYLIENYEIKTSSSSISGISIINTTVNFIIRGCLITGAYEGISLVNIAENTAEITDNTLEKNNKNGIWIEETSGCLIQGNRLSENKVSAIHSEHCEDVLIKQNTCSKNYGSGIVICNSRYFNITENTITDSFFNGILFENSNNSFIYINQLEANSVYGISFSYKSSLNYIYHNNFIDNNNGAVSQGVDNVGDNYWYLEDLQEGNYWSDYSGAGSYEIDGTGNCCDLYPLKKEVPITGSATYYFLIIPLTIILVGILFRRKK